MGIIGDRFVTSDELILVMKENVMFGGEDMAVKDTDGNDRFKVDAA